MKKYFIAIFSINLILITISVSGQDYWAKHIGGNSYERGIAIETDSYGNSYTLGHFIDTIVYDIGGISDTFISVGSQDLFISKLDPNGNLLWLKQIGNGNGVHPQNLAIDDNGNIYIVSQFFDTIDVDPGPGVYNISSSKGYGVFICKLDANGDFVMAFFIDRVQASFNIEVDKNENIFLTGSFKDSADFDPGPGVHWLIAHSLHDEDIFFSKFNKNGNLVWAHSFVSIGWDYVDCTEIDKDGNLITVGGFSGTIDFDPGPGTVLLNTIGSGSNADTYILKLDSNGAFVWVKQLKSQPLLVTVSSDSLNNVYIAGNFVGTVDFDPSTNSYPVTAGDRDGYILKLDKFGDFVYVKTIGSPNCSVAGKLIISPQNDIVYVGVFGGDADFDTGIDTFFLHNHGNGNHLFYARYKLDGEFKWVVSCVGQNLLFPLGFSVDHIGNIYSTGVFSVGANFDPHNLSPITYAVANEDIYIQKINHSFVSLQENGSECRIRIYPNPAMNYISIESNRKMNNSLYKIFDINGKEVKQGRIKSNLQSINISGLGQGTYFINIANYKTRNLYFIKM